MLDPITRDFTFEGRNLPLPTNERGMGPWAYTVVGAAPPTVQPAANTRYLALGLTATNEAQNAVLYFGDQLGISINDLLSIEFWARKDDTAYAAQVRVRFGVASAQNADPDAIAQSAWFGCDANDNIVIETDDGVNNVDDVATGLSLTGKMRRFQIDFASGVQTISPPSKSKGGKANVIFRAENSRGQLVQVGQNQLFDMSSYSGGLQAYATILKSASTAVGNLYIGRVRYSYRFRPEDQP